MIPFSKLPKDDRDAWEFEARKQIYPGLDPMTEEKERQIAPLARSLYYASVKSDLRKTK